MVRTTHSFSEFSFHMLFFLIYMFLVLTQVNSMKDQVEVALSLFFFLYIKSAAF